MILDMKEIKQHFEALLCPYFLEDGTSVDVKVETEHMEEDYIILKRQDRIIQSMYKTFCIVDLTTSTITYLPEVADVEDVKATYEIINEIVEDINPARFRTRRTRDAIQASRFQKGKK